LTLREAAVLVADFETRQAAESRDDPLNDPRSLDDVVEILKRDQLDLFKAGVRYAAEQEGPKAAALRAQIELAWGEAQLLLADVFLDTSGQLRRAVRALEVRVASGDSREGELSRLAELEDIVAKNDALAEALTLQAAEHVGIGIRLAKAIIATHPTDYLGYRVAADYYRLREDWADFDRMVARIEETNPDSNGLVFLRATSALRRDGDPRAAATLFRQALEKDPKFTRAQALLVTSRGSVRETYTEYQRLRALNPQHQIVIWAGEAITAAFESQRSRDR
jgi:tetratricopeptide (TPR) repeat protein